ncbi:MAG: helix-turn-helix transcriptional regulator [Anaerolineales bacterium]|nr:helix-turn-helix transcriptional regulator [Anaerolineales bacterium]
MSVQIIEKDGRPEWAVLPYDEYERLLAAMEMLQDIQAYDEARQALAAGEEELIPAEIADRLIDGANPIRVWRDYRGLTQAELAERAQISAAYLSQLEAGKRAGTTEVLGRVASGLQVTVDDLI